MLRIAKNIVNMEKWADIYDYEGFYQISTTGAVRSISREVPADNRWGVYPRKLKGRILRPPIVNGYYRVGLRRCGGQAIFAVHRLVAEAFVPNPYKKA